MGPLGLGPDSQLARDSVMIGSEGQILVRAGQGAGFCSVL